MSILVRVTARALRYRRRFILAYVCTVGATLLLLAIPRLLGDAVDTALASGVRLHLLWFALAIVGVGLARGGLSYGQGYLSEWVAQQVAYDLRNAIYDKLQRLSFSYHDQQQTGDLMSKATTDVESLRWFVNMGLIRAAHLVVLFIAAAVLLLTLHWQLGLLSLAFLPLAMWRSVRASRRLRTLWRRTQDTLGQLISILQENLSGIRVVKAFGAEPHEQRRFHGKAAEVADYAYSTSREHASISAFLNLVFTLAMGLILWFGARLFIQGELTPGQLTQFLFYMGMLLMPVRTTGWLVNTFSRAVSSGQRVFDVLDAHSPVQEKRGARRVGRLQGHVRFEDVSLHYDGTGPVLSHINLSADPGQVVAVLGPPGGGKSSLLHLVLRFYDVTGGRVTIDGHDVRDLSLESLRRNVGIVLQDVFLFSATLRDNIAYGVPNATQDDIERAARIAQLHDFIAGLSKGYDTWVGERGVTLSGGQRQRLAIARTLLLDPPILILDDSTSSVDAGTEHLIQQALAEVVQGRTTFVVAHRLSTVRRADLLVVLQDGHVVEEGTHRELLAHGGLYRRIYDLQLRPQEGTPSHLYAAGGGE